MSAPIEILLYQSLKPSKLQCHLNEKHPAEFEKSVDYFKQREKHLTRQSLTVVKIHEARGPKLESTGVCEALSWKSLGKFNNEG